MQPTYKTLRLILGDQLNSRHSWFSEPDDQVLYLIAELRQETDYVKHHIQKLCAFFAAMENFAHALEEAGHQVHYLNLDDTAQYRDLPSLIQSICEQFSIQSFEYQRPDEFRLKQQLSELSLPGSIEKIETDTEHFLLAFDKIENEITPGRHNLMESFYRKMRKRFNILMEADKPHGGQWNYDKENRARLKPEDLRSIPEALVFGNDVSTVLTRIKKHHIAYFGREQENIIWPTTRVQAQELLTFFCRHCLSKFGLFQDAMTDQSKHKWSLYHSRLSFALNTKMLHPMQVIEAALDAFNAPGSGISIAQAEGFIRQILGWREYIRAVYWANMPEYAEHNQLSASRTLPDFFWTGDTQMNCMKQVIDQSLDYAYAHHIQRLMITGNFCLLTGISPSQVDDWYLGIYIDALEWVEMPNTRGMSQFADAGLVATKPYAAGGNYINKMSDYCKNCHYDIKQKSSEQACPFNSLYWGFMVQHRDWLCKNPRIGMMYKNWDRQSDESRQAVLERRDWCLEHINQL